MRQILIPMPIPLSISQMFWLPTRFILPKTIRIFRIALHQRQRRYILSKTRHAKLDNFQRVNRISGIQALRKTDQQTCMISLCNPSAVSTRYKIWHQQSHKFITDARPLSTTLKLELRAQQVYKWVILRNCDCKADMKLRASFCSGDIKEPFDTIPFKINI